MKAGLDEKGFRRKQYYEIEEDLFVRAKNYFGEGINTSVRSPLGMFLRVIAWSLSLLWQLAEQVYNQSFLRYAEGVSLDYLVELGDIKRFQAENSRGEITIYGQEGKLIPRGFLVSTASGISYRTTEDALIQNGYSTVSIEAIEKGEKGNIPSGSINQIINPEFGIDRIENKAETQFGRNIETDYELRERYRLSFSSGGTATIAAIRSKLLSISSVKSAIVLENDTMQSVDGIPPKSIKVIVQGGEDQEVAQAILDTKAAGIHTSGDTVVSVKDDSGLMKEIRFQRARQIVIFCKVRILKNKEFKADEDEINKVISSYFNALKMGEKVVHSMLISTVFQKVSGIDDLTISLSKTESNYQKENIEMQKMEIASVNVVEVIII